MYWYWWAWTAILVFLIALPMGYGWGYRGWGPPYPRYYYRYRDGRRVRGVPGSGTGLAWGEDVQPGAGQRALALDEPTLPQRGWGLLADLVWLAVLGAVIWAIVAVWA